MWFIHQACYDELLAIFILGTQSSKLLSVLHLSFGTKAIRHLFILQGTGMVQSVRRRATGWNTWIRFPAVQNFTLLHGPQPAPCPKSTVSFLPGGKATEA
jgi:hypothetical protein